MFYLTAMRSSPNLSSMASFSSSHKQGNDILAFSGIEPPLKRRKVSESSRLYDVFINHRGPDVKNTLALELYKSLERLNIRAFLDSEEKELGESFPSMIENAINSASAHIAIFSKGYAESPWCLAELVLMLQSKAKIIPVFYGVKTSSLRHIEKGEYGKAFTEYENKKRYIEKLEDWRKALQSISFIAGEEFNSFSDCEKIVLAVQKEVERKRCLHVAKYPVGLSKLVEDFQKQCINKLVQDFESQYEMNRQEEGKSKIVGIFGMGGVGKTTLSKELFNRKRSDYSRSCFLFDVREASAKRDLPALQMKLLRELFDEKDLPSFPSVEDGTSYLSNRFARSGNQSFLIVVDDIDQQEQLDALLISDGLARFDNSLIIVTTRDVGVLISAGITVGYHLKGLDTTEAKELFCWHAFSRSYPLTGFEKLVNLFVQVCGGLPLSLQVLGSHVHGEDQKFWELELEKVKKTLPQDILKRLRISIDTLDNEEKQIFMDVACFFIGELKKDAIRVWEGSGWSAQHALRRLKNKCLVEEINDYKFNPKIMYVYGEITSEETSVLRMHDHLRDLGREMADELNHPRRLWRTQHCKPLISKGSKSIFNQTKARCLHTCMSPSELFHVRYFLGVSDNNAEVQLPTLLWLEVNLREYIVTNLPLCIPLQNLQTLKISGGGLKSFWQKDVQAPFQLKELRICRQRRLKELDLGFLRCLEEITILDCMNLKSITGISDLNKLVELNICKCRKLEQLSILRLVCLEKIRIVDCNYLKTVKGISELPNLVEMNIEMCVSLEELSFVRPSGLQMIRIYNFPHLKSVREMSSLRKLVLLNISQCSGLEELNFAQLRCLEIIKIYNCENLKTVIGLSDLPKLEKLQISSCENIEELCLARLSSLEFCIISNLPMLKSIEVKGCKSLISMDGIFWKLVKLSIIDCPKLEKTPETKICSLERMQLLYCSNMSIRDCILNLEKLPSDFIKVIGRARDGAGSKVNANIFRDFICHNSVVENGFGNTCDHLGRHMVSAIVLCAVVGVNTPTAAMTINDLIRECDITPWLKFEVRQGEWMITSVITKEDEIYSYILNKGYCFAFDYLYSLKDVMLKRVTMPVMKGEEHIILDALSRVVDELY